MSKIIDIHEKGILLRDPVMLETILIDRSRPKLGKSFPHIIWATQNYKDFGPEYAEYEQISVESITGKHGNLIQPRVLKTKEEKQVRVRDKGEVFTPAWICNAQNNLVDKEWFGGICPFNTEIGKGWKTNYDPIPFPILDGKTWRDYIKNICLEITCGEAPYLTSRYDAITGEVIPVKNRIGLLDRKLRVAAENTSTPEEWYTAAKIAYQASYGFEWQGDSLLLARENALYSYYEYYADKFSGEPTNERAREIAEIISWNFWQMGGLKGVIPNSCHEVVEEVPSLFGNNETAVSPCAGCVTDDIRRHNGIYCIIMDWETGKPTRFIDVFLK